MEMISTALGPTYHLGSVLKEPNPKCRVSFDPGRYLKEAWEGKQSAAWWFLQPSADVLGSGRLSSGFENSALTFPSPQEMTTERKVWKVLRRYSNAAFTVTQQALHWCVFQWDCFYMPPNVIPFQIAGPQSQNSGVSPQPELVVNWLMSIPFDCLPFVCIVFIRLYINFVVYCQCHLQRWWWWLQKHVQSISPFQLLCVIYSNALNRN